MRVTLERDGKKETADVARDLSSVTVGGRPFPVVVRDSSALKVELEVAGERVVVENWPEHFAEPPGPVDVNGERWTVSVTSEADAAGGTARPAATRPSAPSPIPGAATTVPGGVPLLPPMPGKVVEVRAAEGDRVRQGDVVLVVEAMKMRNEIVSPIDGVVHGLRVIAGANVRAKEAMAYIEPG